MRCAAFLFVLAALLVAGAVVTATDGDQMSPSRVSEGTTPALPASAQLSFTMNMGQWADSILFRAAAEGATVWFTRTGVYHQFCRRRHADSDKCSPTGIHEKGIAGAVDSLETLMIHRALAGAGSGISVMGQRPIRERVNYFLGNDRSRWCAAVPSYEEIVFQGVYPGIDLRFYGDQRRLEYDFIVAPGADYHQVRLEYDQNVSIEVTPAGDLAVETPWGSITEYAPVIYQESDGVRTPVCGRYSPVSGGSVGFELDDSYREDVPLVIDPVMVYGSYLGGGKDDVAWDVAVDDLGAAYVTGWTWSADFPTVNPYDADYNGGSYDMFVAKLSPTAESLQYSTYLGGNGYDYGMAITVDRQGCAYLAGHTSSSNFPMHNSFDAFYGGGGADAIVAKIGPAGDVLEYSSYLGGGGKEWGGDVAVDSAGCAFVTGYTESTDYPVQNALRTELEGQTDAFVTKLNPSGTALIYSTYLGGSDTDQGTDIALDPNGCAYLTGYTRSADYPTSGPFNGTYSGGVYYGDAFVTKIAPLGNTLVYSTYLGGSQDEMGNGIAVDRYGSAYVVGFTKSPDLPLRNAFDALYAGGTWYGDAFVTKLTPAGDDLVYSTYLGGFDDEWGYGIAVDQLGQAFVAGHTQSLDYPTVYAFDDHLDGVDDATLTGISADGVSLLYSTFMGGSSEDYGRAVALDRDGCALLVGYTFSADFPVRSAVDGTRDGIEDAFIVKFCQGCCNGRVGDANGSGDDIPTIGDISVMIDAKFITGACIESGEGANIRCLGEADANLSGGADPTCDDITIGDISMLIDCLFITGEPPFERNECAQ